MFTVTVIHDDNEGDERTFAYKSEFISWYADEPHNPMLVRYDGATKYVQLLRGSPDTLVTTVVEYANATYKREYTNAGAAVLDFLSRI